jgi:hypothetical protein
MLDVSPKPVSSSVVRHCISDKHTVNESSITIVLRLAMLCAR